MSGRCSTRWRGCCAAGVATWRSARSLRDIDRDKLLVGWLPDLVLMDYHLDQTSGLDAVEWLRHNVGGHLPAALVTADRTAAVARSPRSAVSRWSPSR